MSSKRRIVSDAGPLISLEKLNDGYGFIRQLFDTLLVPQVVLDEVAQGQHDSAEAYLRHYRIDDLMEIRKVAVHTVLPESERLHEGEKQAFNWLLNFNCRS